MSINDLPHHYDNELFMRSIPPDKNITASDSGLSTINDLENETNKSLSSPIKVFQPSNDKNSILDLYITVSNCIEIPFMRSYQFCGSQLFPPMVLNETQLDCPIVSIMNELVHYFIISTPDSENGEEINSFKNS